MASVSRPALRSDETGNIFGTFTVLSYAGAKRGKACWNVECKCGFTATALGRNLRRNILPRHKCTIKICRVCDKSEPEVEFSNIGRDGSICVGCKKLHVSEWKVKNRQHVKKHLRQWHTAHPENITKHRATERQRIQSSPYLFLEHIIKHKIRWLRSLPNLSDYRAKQKAKNPERFEVIITSEFLHSLWDTQGGLCALSRMPMLHEFHNPRSVSIDRIDGDLGYIPGNVQLVCQWVNLAKNRFTNEQILAVLAEFGQSYGV